MKFKAGNKKGKATYMNIGILIPELGGGGAERVAQIMGDYYVDKGNNVYYFLADMPVKQVYRVKGQVIHTGIKTCVSNNAFGNVQLWGKLLWSSFQMRKWKKKYRIDVAISFMEEFNYINILSKGREKVITRICIVLSQLTDLTGPLYSKNVVKFFYSKADKVIVLCDCAKDDMHRNYDIGMKKMAKIPNPALRMDAGADGLSWKYGEKVIVTVGRLAQQKQQDRIIRAFSYVNEHIEDARLLILGSGAKEGYLKNVITKCGLEDKVILAGFKGNIGYYLKNSKVFVLASRVEGMPNSMLEAMACGLPIVTTDSPGACGELVGKKKDAGECKGIQYCPYGILTPHIVGEMQTGSALDEKELLLGQAMLEVLSNRSLWEKYSGRSLKRAEMYDIEKVMNKWNKLIFPKGRE